MATSVRFVDRETAGIVEEARHDASLLWFIYGSSLGGQLLRKMMRGKWLSKLYGWYYDWKANEKALLQFARTVGIDIEEAEKPITHYVSRNDYFTRKLKPEVRPIDRDPTAVVSPADACMLSVQELAGQLLPIKGGRFSIEELLHDRELAASYAGGSAAIFRLAPADYHRFHFPDGGLAKPARIVGGCLDSVSAQAISCDPTIYCHNQREIVELLSDGFGRILLVPIGAVMVGRIVHTFAPGRVERGEEQGYFKVGGSAIVMLFEKDRVLFDEDLAANTEKGLETKVKMGTRIGKRKSSSRDL